MQKRLLLTIIFGLSLGMLTSCSNTFDGFGRDVEKAGEKIQKTF